MTIKKTSGSNPVKLYAHVPSRSRQGREHLVTYLRAQGMKRWSCTCENQVMVQTGKRKNCFHIRQVKAQLS